MDKAEKPTRRVFAYMSVEEKSVALARFVADLAELEREAKSNTYPRVVQDAIAETIVKYRRDVAYLRAQVSASRDH